MEDEKPVLEQMTDMMAVKSRLTVPPRDIEGCRW